MFVLTTFSDVIHISPHDFRKESLCAIQDNIAKKYCKKVVQNVGLCINLWDLTKASEGQIVGGSGDVYVSVTFRLVVFRPFKGEVLQGIIADQNPDGIRLHTDFFHDIWIPNTLLTKDAKYTEEENTWIWDIDGGPYFYDKNETVRFRVESEVWHSQGPGKPEKIETDEEGNKILKPLQTQVPYTIVGAMDTDGLGPIFWWQDSGNEAQ